MDNDIIKGERLTDKESEIFHNQTDLNVVVSYDDLHKAVERLKFNKSYCYYCRNETDYTTEDKTKRLNFGSHCLTYNGKDAYCSKCSRRMFVPEIEKYNVDQMEKSLNEFNKIN
jgi:hypothetical protein